MFWGMYDKRINRETALSDVEKIGCINDAAILYNYAAIMPK